MDLLKIFWKIEIDDKIFGKIKFDKKDTWEGMTTFLPTKNNIYLYLKGDKRGPYQYNYKSYNDLENNYNKFVPEISKELFKLYNQHMKDNIYKINTHDELWKVLELDEIIINSISSFDLFFGFTDEVDWGDAQFGIIINKSLVNGHSFSD